MFGDEVKEENDEIEVPESVFLGLEEVRESGRVNMFDWKGVISLLYEGELHEAADWVKSNRSLYAEGIFRGFKSASVTKKL